MSDATRPDPAAPRTLRVPDAGPRARLVIPAHAEPLRIRAAGLDERLLPPTWTRRVLDLGLPSGAEVELAPQPAVADPFGGFLPAIEVPPRGLWQGARWRETGPAWFTERPSARLADGGLRIRARLGGLGGVAGASGAAAGAAGTDPSGAPRAELLLDGRPCHAVAPGVWEIDAAEAPPGWRPGAPVHHDRRLELRVDGELSDVAMLRVADARLRTDGARILFGTQVWRPQGLLHWGHYPECDGPDPEPDALRAEIAGMQERGFDLLKACLWLPPHRFLDVCDEMGMAVWMEYPLWAHALPPVDVDRTLAQYRRWIEHDAAHPCVVLRTLSCENDRVDPEVAGRILDLIEEIAPGGLANDHSAWLDENHRPAFWDEHPYLHAAQWPFWLERTRRALDARPRKPFLLGETMAFDSGADAWSRRAAVRLRRREVEQLRAVFPDAGYVMCAARDIPQSPLGVQDETGAWKTPPEEWAWQRATVGLDAPPLGPEPQAPIEPSPAAAVLTDDDPEQPLELPDGIQVVHALDAEARASLRDGATLLHLPRLAPRAWRVREHTFWCPVASFDAVLPGAVGGLEDALFEDLMSGRSLIPPAPEQALVLAAAQDLHDQSGDALHQPFVLAARVGAGRLLVSSLRWSHPIGRDFHQRLAARFLAEGDAWLNGLAPLDFERAGARPADPQAARTLATRTLFLDGPWELRGEGVADGSQRIVPGTLLAHRGANAVQGWVEAEADVTVPADWTGPRILRAEAIGDGFTLRIDGREVHTHGRPGFTWDAGRDVPATVDLSDHLAPGATARWQITTKDHRGAGALIGPVYLCDGDPDAGLLF